MAALCKEIKARKDEAGEPIRTIYIGGGTPSTLTLESVTALNQDLPRACIEEYTMEINPGDATEEYLRGLRALGVNRLSMGIQSFQDELLRFIGRRHNAQQAIDAVHMAQEAGFENISIDLMYALPGQTMAQWKADIETALGLGVQHISSYGLMYEEGTMLTRMRDKGDIIPIDEETENAMYDTLCERLKEAGFVHYEVSNFALLGYEAKHNSSYWDGSPYLGLGPGAHSYDGNHVRRSNNTSLKEYVQATADVPHQTETLTPQERYDETVMTRLRTVSGLPLDILTDEQRSHCLQMAEQHLLNGNLVREDNVLRLSRKGIFVSNSVISDLMY